MVSPRQGHVPPSYPPVEVRTRRGRSCRLTARMFDCASHSEEIKMATARNPHCKNAYSPGSSPPDLFFGVLRWVKPVLATQGLTSSPVRSVQEVLSRDWVFSPLPQKMERVTAGHTSSCMQNTPEYRAMSPTCGSRCAVAMSMSARALRHRDGRGILAASGGRIDVVQTLTRWSRRAFWALFGTPAGTRTNSRCCHSHVPVSFLSR